MGHCHLAAAPQFREMNSDGHANATHGSMGAVWTNCKAMAVSFCTSSSEMVTATTPISIHVGTISSHAWHSINSSIQSKCSYKSNSNSRSSSNNSNHPSHNCDIQ